MELESRSKFLVIPGDEITLAQMAAMMLALGGPSRQSHRLFRTVFNSHSPHIHTGKLNFLYTYKYFSSESMHMERVKQNTDHL